MADPTEALAEWYAEYHGTQNWDGTPDFTCSNLAQALLAGPLSDVDLVLSLPAMRQVREEIEETDAINARLMGLLTATANALKGSPPAGSVHDWSDLPVVASRVREVIDAAVAYHRMRQDYAAYLCSDELERVEAAVARLCERTEL